jgi:hypothetical protein
VVTAECASGTALLAYPWEFQINADAGMVLAEHGIGAVAIAGAYHAVRALRGRNGGPRVVDMPAAACYWPPGSGYPSRLRPIEPSHQWRSGAVTAVTGSRAAELRVGVWLSVLHSTRLASAAPDLALVNCYGDVYRHALCPSHDEVRDYAATLVADALRALEPDWIELEAVGYHGYAHASLHDKRGADISSATAYLLSLCFCAGCRKAMSAHGLDPRGVAAVVRSEVDRHLEITAAAVTVDVVEPGVTATIAALEEVRRGIEASAVRSATEPAGLAGVPVVIHAGLPPTTVGSRSPLTPALATYADAVVLTTDGLDVDQAERDITTAAIQVDGACDLLASIRCFPPDVWSESELATRLAGAARAGAAGARAHTFGLISDAALSWLGAHDPWNGHR